MYLGHTSEYGVRLGWSLQQNKHGRTAKANPLTLRPRVVGVCGWD